MTKVRIVRNWRWPDFLRQTPNRSGIWEGISFTLEPVEACDYLIVSNKVDEAVTVTCPPEHVWSIVQEPPVDFRKAWHVNPPYSFRMLTTDPNLKGPQYIHSQPAISWHVNQDYDFLSALKVSDLDKTGQLSWITSQERYLKGHRARLKFLAGIQGKLAIDLIATYQYYLLRQRGTREEIAAEQAKLGFVCVEDKWAGLAPYRYSIAVENYSNPLYWSEKLADCYLAWCMPIYYGCTRITDYLPAESLIQIDINQPDAAIEIIQEAIANNAWQRNLDAIAYARELVLNRYQFFPLMARQIRHFESTYGSFFPKKQVTITPRESKRPLLPELERKTKRLLVRLLRLVGW